MVTLTTLHSGWSYNDDFDNCVEGDVEGVSEWEEGGRTEPRGAESV